MPLTLGVSAVGDRRRNICGVPLAVSKTGVFAEWYADQRFCHPGVLATPDEAAQAWSLDDAHSTLWRMVTRLLVWA
jgi:hypothetical protein